MVVYNSLPNREKDKQDKREGKMVGYLHATLSPTV